MIKRLFSFSLIAILSTTTMYGQQNNKNVGKENAHALTQEQKDLFNEISKQDSIFFNAFNSCDSLTYKNYLTTDFEFYHDLGGLHYLDEEMQSIKEMCVKNSHIRRELLKETLEVYKIGNYGALEIGVHSFYHTNPGQKEHISGTYKFIQIWKKQDNFWKISRVISYDHGKMNNN